MTTPRQSASDPASARRGLRPHHVGISFPSLPVGIAWHHDMPGFELESGIVIDSISTDIASVRYDAFCIETFEVSGAALLLPQRFIPNLELSTHGNKHMCFAVESVRDTMTALRMKRADLDLGLTFAGASPASPA
jgi:methylmalonyl-CoA/ethylmalonyl-CoA epimerase